MHTGQYDYSVWCGCVCTCVCMHAHVQVYLLPQMFQNLSRGGWFVRGSYLKNILNCTIRFVFGKWKEVATVFIIKLEKKKCHKMPLAGGQHQWSIWCCLTCHRFCPLLLGTWQFLSDWGPYLAERTHSTSRMSI